jgi:hypothetical protein
MGRKSPIIAGYVNAALKVLDSVEQRAYAEIVSYLAKSFRRAEAWLNELKEGLQRLKDEEDLMWNDFRRNEEDLRFPLIAKWAYFFLAPILVVAEWALSYVSLRNIYAAPQPLLLSSAFAMAIVGFGHCAGTFFRRVRILCPPDPPKVGGAKPPHPPGDDVLQANSPPARSHRFLELNLEPIAGGLICAVLAVAMVVAVSALRLHGANAVLPSIGMQAADAGAADPPAAQPIFIALGLGILGVAVFFAFAVEFGGSLYGLDALSTRKKRLIRSLEEAKTYLAALQSVDAAFRSAIRAYIDELRFMFRRGQEEREAQLK